MNDWGRKTYLLRWFDSWLCKCTAIIIKPAIDLVKRNFVKQSHFNNCNTLEGNNSNCKKLKLTQTVKLSKNSKTTLKTQFFATPNTSYIYRFHLCFFCPNDVKIRLQEINLSSRATDKKRQKTICLGNLNHSNEADMEQRPYIAKTWHKNKLKSSKFGSLADKSSDTWSAWLQHLHALNVISSFTPHAV